MTHSRLLPSVIAFAAALSLGACGREKKLDVGKLENTIKEGIQRQAGARVRSVVCPNDVKVKKGDVFNCKATTTAGQSATVKVTQRDDEGNVRYEVTGS